MRNKDVKMRLTRSKKYKILLGKAWFFKGYNDLGFVKYIIGFIGLEMILGDGFGEALGLVALFAVSCFFYGMFYYKYGWMITEAEVSNQYNKFIHEMRATYKKDTYIKDKKK